MFNRLTGPGPYGYKLLLMDPRCWKIMYHLRLYFQHDLDLGFLPTTHYVMSEVLVNPERGSRYMIEAHRKYKRQKVPAQACPRGGRGKATIDLDKVPGGGDAKEDWGTQAARGKAR